MKRRNNFLPIFLFLVFFSLSLLVLARIGVLNGVTAVMVTAVSPLQQAFYSMTTSFERATSSEIVTKLQEENRELKNELKKQAELVKENQALKDQFETSSTTHYDLVAAQIIGAPGFIPGINSPEYLVINRGANDQIRIGQAVIYKDNLVGIVEKVSLHVAKVRLVTNQKTALTAKDVQTEALGVAKGQGSEYVLFDNVLPSEELAEKDLIVTKGDVGEDGHGIPPDLVIGEVVSIDKKPSALFQVAQVKSLLDFSRLQTVFVVIENSNE